MILFALDKDGAFIVGDTESGFTSYSYPSSPNANYAARILDVEGFAAKIAHYNILWRHAAANNGGNQRDFERYDARNWDRITMEIC